MFDLIATNLTKRESDAANNLIRLYQGSGWSIINGGEESKKASAYRETLGDKVMTISVPWWNALVDYAHLNSKHYTDPKSYFCKTLYPQLQEIDEDEAEEIIKRVRAFDVEINRPKKKLHWVNNNGYVVSRLAAFGMVLALFSNSDNERISRESWCSFVEQFNKTRLIELKNEMSKKVGLLSGFNVPEVEPEDIFRQSSRYMEFLMRNTDSGFRIW